MQTFILICFFQGPGFYKPPSSFDNIPGGKIAFKNGPRLATAPPVENHPPPGNYHSEMPLVQRAGISEKLIESRKKVKKIGVAFKPSVDPPSIPSPQA